MTTTLHHPKRRKIVFINPKFQGGAALAFAAVVVIGGLVFSWFVYRDVRQALWHASLTGHYRLQTAYEVVGASVVRHLVALFAGILVAGIALFFVVIRKIRIGTERIAAVFRLSGEGDLSTPTDAPGLGEFNTFGKQVDAARAQTLGVIEGIRAEVDLMRKESLSQDEFRKRWDGLKEKIGRVAP